MSNQNVTRRLSIYVNEKEIVNSMSGVSKAISSTRGQINNLNRDSANYDEKMAELQETLAKLITKQSYWRDEINGTNSALGVAKNSLEGVETRMKEVEKELRLLDAAQENYNESVAALRQEYTALSAQQEQYAQNISLQTEQEGVSANSLTGVTNRMKEVKDEMALLDTTSEGYQERLAAMRKEYATLEGQQAQYRQDIEGLTEVQTANTNSLEGVEQRLGEVRTQMRQLDTTAANYREELAALQAQEESLVTRQQAMSEEIEGTTFNAEEAKEAMSNIFIGLSTGNMAMAAAGLTAIKGAILTLTRTAMRFIATPLGATIAALAAVALITKEWFDYNKEVAKADKLTQAITKLSGDAADEARVRATAMAKTFDQDFEQLLDTASALVNEFDISYNEAFNRIENGFIKGGDASDEFLESMREYPTFFAQAGFSAAEFQNIINTGADLSIYQDKLPDAIKEFGLAITEQTDAARDALQNAFGEEFTTKLLKGVKDGSVSVKDALYQISAEADRLGLNVQQAQQLTADLFKGAGEDAGGAVKIFNAVTKSVENQKRPLSEVEQAMQDLAQSQEDLTRAQDRFLKSDGFSIWEKRVKESMNNIAEGFYKFLYTMTNSSDQVAKDNLRDLYETTEEIQDDYTKHTLASFEKYVERRKKILGKNFDYQKSMSQYIQDMRDSLKNSDDEVEKERLAGAIKHFEKMQEISNKNNLDDINAQKAADKKRLADLKKHQAELKKEREKAAEEARKIWVKSEIEYYDTDKEISELLKKSQQERDNNRLTAAQKEDAEITQRWEVELEKYKEHTDRRAELEAARDAELLSAKEIRAKESAERIRQMELEQEQERNGRIFSNAMYLQQFESENEMNRAVAKAVREGASQEEIAAIRKKYAERDQQTGIKALDFFVNLKNSEVKWSDLTEKQKLALTKEGLSMAAEMFGKGTGAWKALKIAEAYINTKQAAIAAYQAMAGIPIVGPALGVAAAGVVTAYGVKQVSEIAKTKVPQGAKFFKGGYTGTNIKYGDEYGGVAQVSEFHPNEYVIPAKMMAIPAVANTVAWLENIRTGKAGSAGNSNEIQQIPANSNNSGAAATGDPELKAMLAVLVQRLENPVAPVIVYGYEDLERQNKMQDDISSSKNNGKLST